MLQQSFFEQAIGCPDQAALWVDQTTYSYGQLAARARRVAAGLQAVRLARQPVGPVSTTGTERCLLFASRSVATYAGLLGILDAGMAYVPLNPKQPVARIAAVIKQSAAKLMLVERRCVELLGNVMVLLAEHERPRLFLLDDARVGTQVDTDTLALADQSTAASMGAVADLNLEQLPTITGPYAAHAGAAYQTAFVLFTTGFTGVSSAVPISHATGEAYVANCLEQQIDATEPFLTAPRFVQFCGPTSDPALHDAFVCWANCGCLHVPQTVESLHGEITDNKTRRDASAASINQPARFSTGASRIPQRSDVRMVHSH